MAKPVKRPYTVVDLFCGHGGFTHAAVRAIKKLGGVIEHFIAVNHWDDAIATHEENHKFATHYLSKVQEVKPREAVPSGRVDILLAGPECTFHSNAAGERPINDQSRIMAWAILDWLEKLYINCFIIENVPEFMKWGPLNADQSRNKKMQGATFLSYITALEALGYNVTYKVANSADYGGVTTRQRLFIMGRKKHLPFPLFPEPTHISRKKLTKNKSQFSMVSINRKPWRAAREIIDWDVPSYSIFMSSEDARKVGVRRPLAPNTVRRALTGLFKFGLPGIQIDDISGTVQNLMPFLVGVGGPTAQRIPSDIDLPVHTLHGTNNLGGSEPYLIKMCGSNNAADANLPSPTITADGNHIGLAQPFLLGQQSAARPRPTSQPIPTIATAGAISLSQSVVMFDRGGDDKYFRGAPDDRPLGTLTTQMVPSLITPEAWIAQVTHACGDRIFPLNIPLLTFAGHGDIGLCNPYVMATDQTHSRSVSVYSLDGPVLTITTKNRLVLATPFIAQFNGTSIGGSIDRPVGSFTTRDRFGLCFPVFSGGYLLVDILFRMFQPHEMAMAMGLPRSYKFMSVGMVKGKRVVKKASKKDATKMIGNAVEGHVGYHLVHSLLS